MIIKNIGNKIINIGTEILMPDKQIKVSRETAALPAIEAFAEKGYIEVIDNEKQAAHAAEKTTNDADEKAEDGIGGAAEDKTGAVKTVKRSAKRTTADSAEG